MLKSEIWTLSLLLDVVTQPRSTDRHQNHHVRDILMFQGGDFLQDDDEIKKLGSDWTPRSGGTFTLRLASFRFPTTPVCWSSLGPLSGQSQRHFTLRLPWFHIYLTYSASRRHSNTHLISCCGESAARTRHERPHDLCAGLLFLLYKNNQRKVEMEPKVAAVWMYVIMKLSLASPMICSLKALFLNTSNVKKSDTF